MNIQLNGVNIYVLQKKYTDAETEKLKGSFIQPHMIDIIIQEDSDVYNESGELLLKFRKQVISKDKQDSFYNAINKHANKNSTLRSVCSASEKTTIENGKKPEFSIRTNNKVKSNIFGYFDKFTPKQKTYMGDKYTHVEARQCAWNCKEPESFLQTIPFINEVDELYNKLIPDKYSLQKKKTDEMCMKIGDTVFSTVTTNINFQTALHYDKGDDEEGFGNLSVIQKGDYRGGETCLVQYGVGVNVRSGDILLMGVHNLHGNLPIYFEKDAIRLSIVCYLRINLWKRTRNWSQEKCDEHISTINNLHIV
jgi:hypothetical protein